MNHRRLVSTVALLVVLTGVSCAETDAPPRVSASSAPASEEPTTDSRSGSDEPAPPTASTSSPLGTAQAAEGVAAGPVTVIALGDSLTEGSGDSEGTGYPARLERLIDAARPGSTVTNLGRSGWDSTNLISGQDGTPGELPAALSAIEAAIGEGRGAIATVLIGSNDLWYAYEYGAESGTTASDENDVLGRFRSNLNTICQQLAEAGAVVVIGRVDDQSKRPVAADDTLRRSTFPSTSSDEVRQMSVLAARMNDVIDEVGRAHRAIVAPTDLALFTDPSLLADDGNHPNGAGYDILAAAWLESLRPVLS